MFNQFISVNFSGKNFLLLHIPLSTFSKSKQWKPSSALSLQNNLLMGFSVLRASPLSSSRALLCNPTSVAALPILRLPLRSSHHSSLSLTHFESSSSSANRTSFAVSATRFGGAFALRPRSFRRGRVLAMSSPNSVQKSEEEWRAILSPEQFRILRQKGTE